MKICNIVKQAAEDLTGEEVLAIGWSNGPGSGLIELEGGETIHMDDWLANGYLQYERGRFELVEGDFGPFGTEARGITYIDANPEQTQEANATCTP